MLPALRRLTLLALTLLPVACRGGYDFDKARLPNGGWDFPKLIADYEAGGQQKLSQGSWVPLLHLHTTSFERLANEFPQGFALEEADFTGPLFCIGDTEKRLVTATGEVVEFVETDWWGWSLLYYGRDQRIATTQGQRRMQLARLLLIFGGPKVHYEAVAESK
ncbi:MAG: hypothetical protein RL398_2794 [Planctomycetota bacterium]|jgi:hypothetical protein